MTLELLRAASPDVRSLLPTQPLEAAQSAKGRQLLEMLTTYRPLGVYVSGLPGVGKSTLLLHMILEDIRAGRSCCVIDPHGDLVTAILARCPDDEELLRRIVLFDPSDTEWPVGLNMLDVGTERTRELAVQFMIDLFEELFLPDQQGPILHQSVRNGMRLLIETQGSLVELPLLFASKQFARKKLEACSDPWVRHYFENVWLEVTGSSRGEYLAYFTSKVSCFLDDPTLRNILGQTSGLDLSTAMNEGSIVLANLSRGAIGELNSRLLGMILLHKLERVAVERCVLSPDSRRRVHVYVDEFQEVATAGLTRFLPAARKFGVGLTLAHQRLESLDRRLQEGILGSVGHAVLFRQGSGDALRVGLRLVWPFGERELGSLADFEAVVRATGASGRRELGRLRVPPPGPCLSDALERVRLATRARVGRRRKEVEGELLERLGWSA